MTAADTTVAADACRRRERRRRAPDSARGAHALRSGRVIVGGGMLLVDRCSSCLVHAAVDAARRGTSLVLRQRQRPRPRPPAAAAPQPRRAWFGTDTLGRSLLGRCLLGGTISLADRRRGGDDLRRPRRHRRPGRRLPRRVGRLAADAHRRHPLRPAVHPAGHPVQDRVRAAARPRCSATPQAANLVVLFLAIGLVSWLTMARVVRGQVLSLRAQPFIEACRAVGLPSGASSLRHLLPNLVGPITVYATLTVPQAILQESFLSFLGVGIQPAAADVGLAGQRRAAAGAEPGQAPLVDAGVPVYAAGRHTAEPELPGRRAARRVRPEARGGEDLTTCTPRMRRLR